MPACAAGHDSATTDYCDVCGIPLGAAPDPAPTAQLPAAIPTPRCANCGAAKDGRFCEVCGHDGATAAGAAPAAELQESDFPEPAAGAGWSALVQADHAWFDEVRRRDGPDAAGLEFPRYCPDRRFTLSGSQLAIGRRSRSRGIEPEIDLSGPPLDPGVSALHALLLPRAGGGWEVVDLASTNGTTIGDSRTPIAPNTPYPLADGDRIRIGAWTTITISRPEKTTLRARDHA